MASTASLSLTLLTAQPGGQASCDVRIRNTGTVVDEFTFEVLGDAAPWAEVEPPTLSLFPGDEGAVTVRFSVPRASDVRAGDVPFAVKVISREDPQGTVVEEGTLRVGEFADLFAELLPRTSRGSRTGRHELAFDNRGNSRVNANLRAADSDELLNFRLDPPALVADPGTAAFARIVAVPRKRFWQGAPQTRAFQVLVEADGQGPLQVQGAYLQEPILPRWFWKAVALAAALLVLLVVLWFTLFKPTLESAAKEAAEDAVATPLKNTNSALKDLAAKVGAPVPDIPTSTEGGNSDEAATSALGAPFDRRMTVKTGPNTSGEDVYEVPKDQVVSLTDILLQNPNADTGRLIVRRGDAVLLTVNLSNFRDLDYHFVAPVIFGGGQKLVLRVECANPGVPPGPCTPAAYVTGFVRTTT